MWELSFEKVSQSVNKCFFDTYNVVGLYWTLGDNRE
jgi:hypothetical protein